MKYAIALFITLLALSAQAQEKKPLSGHEYAVNALSQKENIIMQLLDQIVELRKQLDEKKKDEAPK